MFNQIIIKSRTKILVLLFLMLLILLIIPLFRQGILINDELQSRYLSFQSSIEFLNHYYRELIFAKGRAISIFVPIFTYLGFFTHNHFLFRLIAITVLVSNLILACFLIYKLFAHQKLVVIYAFFWLAFLPISFEHAPPNAYVAMYGLPFSALLLSLIYFINYLQQPKFYQVIIIAFLYFISVSSYEIFLPLALLFPLISKYLQPKNWLRACWPIFFTLIFYFFLYLSGRYFLPSHYQGNQIGWISLTAFINALFRPTLNAFPGINHLTLRQLYLFNLITDGQLQVLWQLLKNFNLLDSLKVFFNFFNLRLGLLVITSIAFLWFSLFAKKNKIILEKKQLIMLSTISFILMILVNLPLSITSHYQTIYLEQPNVVFTPTYIAYFFGIFILSILLLNIKNKIILFFITLFIVATYTHTQVVNEVFSHRQLAEQKRLEKIENFLKGDNLTQMDGYQIGAAELYNTRFNLAFDHHYWTNFAHLHGLNIQLDAVASESVNIIYDPDGQIKLINLHEW